MMLLEAIARYGRAAATVLLEAIARYGRAAAMEIRLVRRAAVMPRLKTLVMDISGRNKPNKRGVETVLHGLDAPLLCK